MSLLLTVLIFFFIPSDNPINEMIDEMSIRGFGLVRFVNDLPYDFNEMVSNIDISRKYPVLEKRLLSFKNLNNPRIFYTKINFLSDTVQRAFTGIATIFKFQEFDVFFEPVIKFGESTEYPSRRWRNFVAGDLIRAYGNINIGPFNFMIGRETIKWGPGRKYPLLISGTAPPFDLFYVAYQKGIFKGTFFTTFLDPYKSGDTLIRRLYSAHRLCFSLLNDHLLLGLSETVLYSGKNLSFLPSYLNPFLFYFSYRYNRVIGDLEDNLGWDIDFSYYIKNKLCIYGELFIDDAQYEKTKENIPNMLGYQIGIKGADFPFIKNSFWTLQGTRVDTWTYIHRLNENHLLFFEYPIGHPAGGDFYELYTKILKHLNNSIDIFFEYFFREKGEVNFDEWLGTFPENPRFPSGKVQVSSEFKIGLNLFKIPRGTISISGGYTLIKNYSNVEGKKKNFPSFSISSIISLI